jgi:hypothetical protein
MIITVPLIHTLDFSLQHTLSLLSLLCLHVPVAWIAAFDNKDSLYCFCAQRHLSSLAGDSLAISTYVGRPAGRSVILQVLPPQSFLTLGLVEIHDQDSVLSYRCVQNQNFLFDEGRGRSFGAAAVCCTVLSAWVYPRFHKSPGNHGFCAPFVTALCSQFWCQAPSGAQDQIFVSVKQLRFCRCEAPSLTRERVCHSQRS